MGGSDRVQIRRGLRKKMPKYAPSGEPLFCTDTKALFIGTGNGVAKIAGDNIYDGGNFTDSEEEGGDLADGGEF